MSTSVAIPASPTFNGQSQFAASLQQVITRSVGIASLPLDSEQATLTTLTGQQTGVVNLRVGMKTYEQGVVAQDQHSAEGVTEDTAAGGPNGGPGR